MTAALHVLTGSQAGQRLILGHTLATVGRDPGSTLRFDPEAERMVSATHATVEFIDGRWRIRDEASLNGTYVNGRRIKSVTLRNGDHLRFGSDGPEVQFVWPDDPGVPTGAARHRWALFGGVVVLLVAVAAIVLAVQEITHRDELSRVSERADSLLALAEREVADLEGRMEELATALRASQDAALSLERQLEDAQRKGDDTRVEELEGELQELTSELTRLRHVASLDFEQIRAANEDAVALLYAEFERGRVVTATAFAVRANGTLITSRHVVLNDSGQRPGRLAVQFARSDQTFRARLVNFARDLDLAIVKVDDILGDVPTIAGIATDLPKHGDPVAVIGFPLGGRAATHVPPGVPQPVMSAGTVTQVEDVSFEFDGYGAAGASGSPVFRADGMLVGVLYGAENREAGGKVLGVPATFVTKLLDLNERRPSPRSD